MTQRSILLKETDLGYDAAAGEHDLQLFSAAVSVNFRIVCNRETDRILLSPHGGIYSMFAVSLSHFLHETGDIFKCDTFHLTAGSIAQRQLQDILILAKDAHGQHF